MNEVGYIKLYRKIKNSPIWADPFKYKLWNLCLMKATHTEQKYLIGNSVITLNKGQFVTGRNALESEFNDGASKKNTIDGLTLMRWLDLFADLEMLNIKKTNKYSVVTVNNWSKYQIDEQQANNKRTSTEHQLNTNKNVKNVNNDKNELKEREKEKYGIFENVLLTSLEYEKVCYIKAEEIIDSLSSYIESKGKSYKSHYATIINWAKRDGLVSDLTIKGMQDHFKSKKDDRFKDDRFKDDANQNRQKLLSEISKMKSQLSDQEGK
ncbi:MAG: hypothetical protein ACK5LC_14915 [Coprobacillaceae bacterium]